MSKPRISIIVYFDTLAHANTAKTALENRIAGKDVFDLSAVTAFTDDMDGRHMLRVEGRFNSAVDRDDVLDWIRDQVDNHPQVKTWVTGYQISRHECSHDDPEVKNCRTTGYTEWKR